MNNNFLFESYVLNPTGKSKAGAISEIFGQLLDQLGNVCFVQSREFEQVKLKLEEACFYAKKAMAVDYTNQVIQNIGGNP